MINFVCTDPLCPIRGTSSATCYRCGVNTVQNEPPNWRERAERAEAERDAALRESLILVKALVEQTEIPEGWKPLPDLAGIITQISNIVAGLRADRDALRADAARLDWLERHWYDGVIAKTEAGWLTWQYENYAPTLREAIDDAVRVGDRRL